MRRDRRQRGRVWPGIAVAMLTCAGTLSVARGGHDFGWTVLKVTPEIAKRYVDDGIEPIFIDLRPAGEFARGRIQGARSVPLPEVARRAADVPKAGFVILYGACPFDEASTAYQILRDLGYRNISVMEEGFAGWTKRGYQIER